MTSIERWQGKVALVTGASSGIGAAIAVALANQGLKVVGLGRRQERIDELKKDVKGPGELYSFKADVSKEEEIEAAFKFVKAKFGTIHVLVNNAGILRPGKLSTQDPKFLREVFDVNVMGLSLCTQQALKLMKESGVDDGHIIHINSIMGHQVASYGPEPILSIYPASKYAVTALTEILRQELRADKSRTRITSLSPGYVDTEIMLASTKAIGVNKSDIPETEDMPALKSEDIADAVIYVLSTPPRVQIHELTIKPVGEAF